MDHLILRALTKNDNIISKAQMGHFHPLVSPYHKPYLVEGHLLPDWYIATHLLKFDFMAFNFAAKMKLWSR